MTSDPLSLSNIYLRYGSADVFERADTRTRGIPRLTPSDVFTVQNADGPSYRVEIRGGVAGFVCAHDVKGAHMPLADREQQHVDNRAALAPRSPSGWRGLVQRLQSR
jgi:hypothetical protein